MTSDISISSEAREGLEKARAELATADNVVSKLMARRNELDGRQIQFESGLRRLRQQESQAEVRDAIDDGNAAAVVRQKREQGEAALAQLKRQIEIIDAEIKTADQTQRRMKEHFRQAEAVACASIVNTVEQRLVEAAGELVAVGWSAKRQLAGATDVGSWLQQVFWRVAQDGDHRPLLEAAAVGDDAAGEATESEKAVV